MQRPPGKDPHIVRLEQQVTMLENKLKALERCLVVDASGTKVTLKSAASLTIEAGAALDIKSSGQVAVKGSIIKLN